MKKIIKSSITITLVLVSNILLSQNPGAPDGGLPPMHPLEPCGVSQTQEFVNNEVKDVSFHPREEVLYNICDNVFYQTKRGKKYIENFNYISKVEKDFTKLNINSIKEIINIMPLVYTAYENYTDSKYTDVIIDKEFNDKLVNVLNSYKRLSSDNEYNSIISQLIKDVKYLKNKTKSEVKDFMRVCKLNSV